MRSQAAHGVPAAKTSRQQRPLPAPPVLKQRLPNPRPRSGSFHPFPPQNQRPPTNAKKRPFFAKKRSPLQRPHLPESSNSSASPKMGAIVEPASGQPKSLSSPASPARLLTDCQKEAAGCPARSRGPERPGERPQPDSPLLLPPGRPVSRARRAQGGATTPGRGHVAAPPKPRPPTARDGALGTGSLLAKLGRSILLWANLLWFRS